MSNANTIDAHVYNAGTGGTPIVYLGTAWDRSVDPQVVNTNDRVNAFQCDTGEKLIFHSLLPIDNDRMNDLFAKIQAGTLSNSEKLAIAVLAGSDTAVWPLLDAALEDFHRPGN